MTEYPFTGQAIPLHGNLRYHYLDEGTGPPLVMVHGNPTWSFYYRNLVLGLRDKYRCIVPDHIGCGMSDKPTDAQYRFTLEQRARDLEALLDHLGVTKDITLVLHDWGGMIGMTYAHWHPERIARLVILNTSAFHKPEEKSLPWSIWLARNTPLGPWLVCGLNLFCKGAVKHCVVRKPLSPEVADGYLQPYDSWEHRLAVLRFVQDIPLKPKDTSYPLVSEVQDELVKFAKTPMLICWGMRDFVFDVHFLNEWIRRFPSAEVHRFDDAGHYVLEDAGPEILGRIRNFLHTHPLPANP